MAFASVLKIANSIVSAVATVTSVSIMAFSGYMIYETQYVQNRAYGAQAIEYKPVVQEETVSIEAMLENIPDAVGWITVDGTHIDYPVVQGEDDLFYASRDVYRNPSLTGAIYMQYQNKQDLSESYSLLYGHHMDNGAMFGDLTKYLDAGYFNSHLSGSLVALNDVYDIEVMSVIKTDAYEKSLYGVTSLDWDGYNEQILNNSNVEVIHQNPEITSADKFLVLSTCEGADTDGRVLLVCRLVKTNQKVEPTVVPPTPTPAVKGDETTPTPTPKGDAVIVKTGDPNGDGMGWALLNLCCLILTITTILPYALDLLDNDKSKERARTIKNYIGPFANVILAIMAIFIFVTYENMKLPMIIKDRYTPWMLIILGVALVSEEICSRRKKKDEEKKTGEERVDV
ncbi:MAG: class B sortase [Clostridiales bacterium]|nr:class B sortase [Clostridiales bacterium]